MTKSVTPCVVYMFITCQRIGRPPISIMGFGRRCDSSEIRVPMPPARITAFIVPSRSTPLEETLRPVGDPFANDSLVEGKFGFLQHEVGIAREERLDGRERVVPGPVRRSTRRTGDLRHDSVAGNDIGIRRDQR